MDVIVSKVHSPMALAYKSDQWSPFHSDGRKRYSRDQLLSLRMQNSSQLVPKCKIQLALLPRINLKPAIKSFGKNVSVSSVHTPMKFAYRPYQWNPSHPDRNKHYTREQLLLLRMRRSSQLVPKIRLGAVARNILMPTFAKSPVNKQPQQQRHDRSFISQQQRYHNGGNRGGYNGSSSQNRNQKGMLYVYLTHIQTIVYIPPIAYGSRYQLPPSLFYSCS